MARAPEAIPLCSWGGEALIQTGCELSTYVWDTGLASLSTQLPRQRMHVED